MEYRRLTQEELDKELSLASDYYTSNGEIGRPANFAYCDLRGLDFSKSLLRDATFEGALLEGVRLRGTFIGCDFANSKMSGVVLNGTFEQCDFFRANLKSCNILNAEFSRTVLVETNLQDVYGKTTYFDKCIMCNSDFENAKLQQATITSCNLDNCVFNNALMSDAMFENNKMYDVDLSGSLINPKNFINNRISNNAFKNASIAIKREKEQRDNV